MSAPKSLQKLVQMGQMAAIGPRLGLQSAPNHAFDAQKCRHLKYQPTTAASAVVVQTFPNICVFFLGKKCKPYLVSGMNSGLKQSIHRNS
jgi:hypothetical protein